MPLADRALWIGGLLLGTAGVAGAVYVATKPKGPVTPATPSVRVLNAWTTNGNPQGASIGLKPGQQITFTLLPGASWTSDNANMQPLPAQLTLVANSIAAGGIPTSGNAPITFTYNGGDDVTVPFAWNLPESNDPRGLNQVTLMLIHDVTAQAGANDAPGAPGPVDAGVDTSGASAGVNIPGQSVSVNLPGGGSAGVTIPGTSAGVQIPGP